MPAKFRRGKSYQRGGTHCGSYRTFSLLDHNPSVTNLTHHIHGPVTLLLLVASPVISHQATTPSLHMASSTGSVENKIDIFTSHTNVPFLQVSGCYSSYFNKRVVGTRERGYYNSYGRTTTTKHFWKRRRSKNETKALRSPWCRYCRYLCLLLYFCMY